MYNNMSYLWKEFNIKTFDAETVVFRNGAFCPELSTLDYSDINQTFEKPVHFIYVGEIAGKNELNINLNSDNQKVFVSVKIQNKKPAFLNILCKNTGKNSEILAGIVVQNYSDFNLDCKSIQNESNNSVLIKTRLMAHKNSNSVLSGIAEINKNCVDNISDISFGAMADESASIQFLPAQKIKSVPMRADHSAFIYQANDEQVNYLRQSGLSGAEIKKVLEEAFLNDIDLF